MLLRIQSVVASIWMTAAACGCASSERREPPAVMMEQSDHEYPGDGGMLQHYTRDASDPEWMARVGGFHGHLGPWVVLGALVGRDAVKRLETPGYWDVEVVAWMPPEKQRQPWSCILDGLQVATGATLGKQNIRFDYSPVVVRNDRPVVYVIRKAGNGRGREGLSYRVNDTLAAALAKLEPARLEELSRDLRRRLVDDLFDITALPPEEMPPAH